MTDSATARQHLKSLVLAGSFGIVALTAAAQANAGCFNDMLRLAVPSKTLPHAEATAPLRAIPAVYRPADAASASFLRIGRFDDGDDRGSDEPIVGLWEFKFAGSPPPDFGTQAWHSDGTELMFSAGRAPSIGDICQGVWKKIGRRTYSLNHIAMGWDTGSFGVRVHIRAIVKVAPSGDAYTAHFTADAYSVSPADPFDESVSLGESTGIMTATRVKP